MNQHDSIEISKPQYTWRNKFCNERVARKQRIVNGIWIIRSIASAIIGGTLLTGGVGNVIGTLFGVLSLKTINNIVIASGLREPYWQSITTGLILCFFILLQSVILTIREGSMKRD